MAGKQKARHQIQQAHPVRSAAKSQTSGILLPPRSQLGKAIHRPATLSQQAVLALQSIAGNRAVTSLLNQTPKQEQNLENKGAAALPGGLKESVEKLSGVSLDDVKVHYNSREPQTVGALAYARGTDIHLGTGQEQHLAHEAWHVVQQKMGRVAPTMHMKNAALNNDNKLEREADSMGEKARQMTRQSGEHHQGCGCASCSRTGPKMPGFAMPPAIAAQKLGTPSGTGVIQRKCTKCGADDHKTSRCPQTKQQRDEHQSKVQAFQAAKSSQLASMVKQEKEGGAGATEAFKKKHVVRAGKSLAASSREVAETRSWGGGRESGRSTVVDISPEDLQKESRFAMESLKFSEADVSAEGSVAPKFGVNKPTKFNYRTQSSAVQSTGAGGRSIKEDEAVLSKPVLALQGKDVHHLHGVDEADS